MGAKSPTDNHGQPDEHNYRRGTEDDATGRAKITLGQRERDRGDQQVPGGKRQLVANQRRHPREGTEPPAAGKRAGGAPAHQNDRDQQPDRHQTAPRDVTPPPGSSITFTGLPCQSEPEPDDRGPPGPLTLSPGRRRLVPVDEVEYVSGEQELIVLNRDAVQRHDLAHTLLARARRKPQPSTP
jgi:hypothetical protein